MKVRVPPGRDTPLYANGSVIDQTPEEIILNFVLAEGQIQGQEPSANLVAKIVMTPSNARRMMNALQQCLDNHAKAQTETKQTTHATPN